MWYVLIILDDGKKKKEQVKNEFVLKLKATD